MTATGPTAGLVLPDYGGRCLDSVLPAVADCLGADLATAGVSGGAATDPRAARERLGLPQARRVCVVLVDGLGDLALAERSGHAPFLRSRLADALTLTSGFPSTTAASLGTFGTGCAPGRTGLVGYTARNPATGGLANLVSWDGAGPARAWQTAPPVFEGIAGAGIAVTSVGPGRFAGSGLTEAALRGGAYRAAERPEERVDAVLAALRAPGPSLVYLYWGEVDKVGHHHGWRSWQWGEELGRLDGELARLARSLPADTLLLVTADHGMVDVDLGLRWDVAAEPELAAGVDLVAGEPRACHVYCAEGVGPEEVAARWRAFLGDHAVVATRAQAVADGWFGPVSPHVAPRIGDVVVAATGRAAIVDSRTQTPASLELIGLHGSLTAAEMQVPLVIG